MAPGNKNKNKNKTHILFRYGLISLLFLMLAGGIIYQLFMTTVIERSEWEKMSQSLYEKLDTIEPVRGNIYASNGALLACDVRVFDIWIDCSHPAIERVEKNKKIPIESIDSLAEYLDANYPKPANLASLSPAEREEKSWKRRLHRQFLEKKRKDRSTCILVKKGATLAEYDTIKKAPLFRRITGEGRKHPLYYSERSQREYPFGNMARRSVGRVTMTADKLRHGYAGIEKDLDTFLFGKIGYKKLVAMTQGLADWPVQHPQRGYNVYTTIDIDIQDMLEEELLKVCQEVKADWGCAIIMEVKTGEIKALSNLQLLESGEWGEALNRAVEGVEPGSVIKPITIMIAFEDGLIKSVNDMVDCSPFMQTSDPHAPAVKNVKQVVEMSSNTGTARILFRGYGKQPEKYYDRLKSIGFFEPMKSGIGNETTPIINRLDSVMFGRPYKLAARQLDLARQAYGYNTRIPPIYTLAYYNALANGGLFVTPHIATGYSDEFGNVSDLPHATRRVCSEETARKVRECIREVVWGKHGTGRKVQDERVEIAGKTGTAYPYDEDLKGYDKTKRRYAFCGFFPYDNPQYSCIVLIKCGSGTSAASTSGQVLKNVALKLNSRGKFGHTAEKYAETKSNTTPVLTRGDNVKTLPSLLGLKSAKYYRYPPKTPKGTIPSVVGLDTRSALAILEKEGLRVSISGRGTVVSQTPEAGSPLKRGDKVELRLKN